ncbi:hypothetical protein Lal_00019245 [Lupinus albus]|nr:hypothetical protein Lal_00019245 [Lupinus albus]
MEVKLNGRNNFWKKQQVSELWQWQKQQQELQAEKESESGKNQTRLEFKEKRTTTTLHHVGEEREDEEDQDSSHQNQDSTFQYLQQPHQQQSHVALNINSLSPLLKKRSFHLPPPHPLLLSSPPSTVKHGTRGMRSTTTTGVGEIVEVQGGHIVRSTGRKDRHSKVCTAKGTRDRRVRLSAHTAIQFYDVQDRLGYDRPSKAVDWLIKKAKAAIDQLAELPAWNPTAAIEQQQQQINEILRREPAAEDGLITDSSCCNGSGRMSEEFQQQQFGAENNNNDNNNNNSNKYNSAGSGFLPPSMDTEIADTIKSFFPMVAAAETTTSFHNYSTPPDLLSRTTTTAGNHNHQQDLRLSLQSFQDPILLHHQQQQQQNQTQNQNQQVLFNGISTLGFDGAGSSGWSEQHHQHEHEHEHEHEHGRFHRMVAWNASASDDSNSSHGGGFLFNSPPPYTVASAAMFGHHGQYFSQRGPLQSSNTPSIRAWIDSNSLAAATTVAAVSHPHYHHHYLSPAIHQASASGFASPYGGFSGFRIPARIQGEEEHDGVSDKPSSASSDSRH